jgi:hypothetical protein
MSGFSQYELNLIGQQRTRVFSHASGLPSAADAATAYTCAKRDVHSAGRTRKESISIKINHRRVVMILLGCTVAFLAVYDAQHPLTDLPESSSNVEAASMILGYDTMSKCRDVFAPAHAISTPNVSTFGFDLTCAELPLEEDLTVLFGILNSGTRALNVTSIVGSVNSPLDFKFYAQNVSVCSFFWPPDEHTK